MFHAGPAGDAELSSHNTPSERRKTGEVLNPDQTTLENRSEAPAPRDLPPSWLRGLINQVEVGNLGWFLPNKRLLGVEQAVESPSLEGRMDEVRGVRDDVGLDDIRSFPPKMIQ